MNDNIAVLEKNVLKTYNRIDVVFIKGEEVYLYDDNNKKYLDFLSGIGVIGLGYSNDTFINNIKDQFENLIHVSNLFYNVKIGEAAEKLIQISGMDKVFFTNSGAEAIEGAIKTAKKYAYNKNKVGKYEIIAFKNSFHGRTLGALAITGNEDYRKPFMPILEGVKFAEINNIDSVTQLINENTMAIIIEPIQGEGGINVASESFLKELESICKKKDILLILDEIQCGVGRTGTFYRYQKLGLSPDIVTTAKSIGNGIPVGAFLVNENVAKNSLKPGDHGTTYGGNPIAGRAVSTVIDIFKKDNILDNVNRVANYFEKKLDMIVQNNNLVLERRGVGLIQGLKLSESLKSGEIMKQALGKGLVIGTAEGNVLRFLPPLIIQEEHVDKMIGILEDIIK